MNNDFTRATGLFEEGNRLVSAGNISEGKARLLEAIKIAPDFAEAHTNLGQLLDQENMFADAEQHYKQSIAINPNIGETHMNLGVLMFRQKRLKEAYSAYRRALELTPGASLAWSNMGVLQICLRQDELAERSLRTAIGLDPNNRTAHFNLSHLLLRQGRLEEGWRCLEERDWYARTENTLSCPRWRGESLKGKSLLIGLEAGHGDMIQFSRYAAVLKAHGAGRITMVCHPALKALLTTLDGVDTVINADEIFTPSDYDFWTPPLSMPFYCHTRLESIPANIPYLRASRKLVEKWAPEIFSKGNPADLRVGLVWKGNPRFENDTDRSLPSLKTLKPLGTIEGVRLFSLQKGAGEDEAASPPASLPLTDLGSRISDFSDSAAIVENLHLIICVDTAIAHLAGAMGKDCWVLLPDYKTDWRWLTGREDSPWYPGTMRLFRQSMPGDWTTVISEVRAALQKLAATSRPA